MNIEEQNNENKEYKESKLSFIRVLIACIILILVAIILGLSVTCLSFYQALHRLDRVYDTSGNTTTERTVTAIDRLNEIVSYYNKYYVNNVDNEALKKALIDTYFDEIGDKYGCYYTKEEYEEIEKRYAGEGEGIGIVFDANEQGAYIIRTMKNSPADEKGLSTGDIITKLGEIELAGLNADEIKAVFQNYESDECPITYLRDGEIITVTVPKTEYEYDTVYCKMTEYEGIKIAKITIENFYENTPDDLKETLTQAVNEGAQGIVFDLRGNPGGLLSSVTKMLDYLLPEGPIAHINYKDTTKSTEYNSDSEFATDLPMAVLVNGNTASAAELFTATLKDYKRATIVGTTTYGKGCGQQSFKLSDGSMVKLTTFYYNSAYSDNYEGIGIEPDIVVELETKGKSFSLMDINEDNQLREAVENIINNLPEN